LSTLLQITDCHLMAPGKTLMGVDTQASLESVLDTALARHEVDAIVASGDLAHEPQASVYARFIATVRDRTSAPVLCIPGNHDVLHEMASAGLPMEPLEFGTWAVVSLDSHVDDTVPASVTAEDRAATAAAIAGLDHTNVLVATHHPMVDVACPWLDKDRIQDAEELLEWLSECIAAAGTSFRGVLFGHAHQTVTRTHEGRPLLGCPSTCFQFLPQSEKFALDDESPGYRIFDLHDDGSFKSVVERTGFPIDPAFARR
jgi:Icc protein